MENLVQSCGLQDLAVFKILQYSRYCGLQDLAVFKILRYSRSCGLQDRAIFKILRSSRSRDPQSYGSQDLADHRGRPRTGVDDKHEIIDGNEI